mmetsp:Transcript_9243/g.22558  ORF Transcript_9243/g.22558 Transcript_9243/m.22558 type:complete len:232 (-) Transcript_9243:492-1187(-)
MPSQESTLLEPTLSTRVWRPLPNMEVPSWSPSPREADSSSRESPSKMALTRPPLPEPLLVPNTSMRLPRSTVSPSSSTLTIAKRLGFPGSTASLPLLRSTSPRRARLSSPPTCLTFRKSPLRRTLASARTTLRSSLKLESSLSSSLVSLVERRMAWITRMLTHPVFTLNPRRSSMLTSSFLRSRVVPSPALPPSAMFTACTRLEMLTFSQSSFTTHRNTSKRRSDLRMTSR